MSIFTKIASGLGKFENFILALFTKEQAVVDAFTKLEPQTKAAILATFYDVTKAVAGVGAEVGAIATGNLTLAAALSPQTFTLIQGVVTDAKNDASVAASDLKALGIAIATPTPPATT